MIISSKCAKLIDALNEATFHTNMNGEAVSEKYKDDEYADILDAFRYATMSAEKGLIKSPIRTIKSSLSRGYGVK